MSRERVPTNIEDCIEDEECLEALNDDWWWRMERELKSDW